MIFSTTHQERVILLTLAVLLVLGAIGMMVF